MDQMDATEALLGGYSHEALSRAFDRVRNKSHWKDAIDAIVLTVNKAELDLILFAVEFYTATKATAVCVRGEVGLRTYRITAPGYWAGPAN